MIRKLGEKSEKLDGRRISPVKVFDGQDGWSSGCEALEQCSKRNDELRLEGLRIRLQLRMWARFELDTKQMRHGPLNLVVLVTDERSQAGTEPGAGQGLRI